MHVGSMKALIRRLVPGALVGAYRSFALAGLRRVNATRTIRDVFTRAYAKNQWGGDRGQFCSGTGSSDRQAAPYAEMVKGFIRENAIQSIVDLGCGDFVVGRALQLKGLRYVGIDIVEELIARNQRLYATDEISFLCLDIITDELPGADLCLIRQVFQHLSNTEILSVLGKIARFQHVMVTEHYPGPSVAAAPNVDKPHGSDTRIYDNSAVYLDQPPFSVPNPKLVLQVEVDSFLKSPGETIRSFLIENR